MSDREDWGELSRRVADLELQVRGQTSAPGGRPRPPYSPSPTWYETQSRAIEREARAGVASQGTDPTTREMTPFELSQAEDRYRHAIISALEKFMHTPNHENWVGVDAYATIYQAHWMQGRKRVL